MAIHDILGTVRGDDAVYNEMLVGNHIVGGILRVRRNFRHPRALCECCAWGVGIMVLCSQHQNQCSQDDDDDYEGHSARERTKSRGRKSIAQEGARVAVVVVYHRLRGT